MIQTDNNWIIATHPDNSTYTPPDLINGDVRIIGMGASMVCFIICGQRGRGSVTLMEALTTIVAHGYPRPRLKLICEFIGCNERIWNGMT